MLQRTKAKQVLKGKTLSPRPRSSTVPARAVPTRRPPRRAASPAQRLPPATGRGFVPRAAAPSPAHEASGRGCPGASPREGPALLPPPGDSQRPILRGSPRTLPPRLQTSQKNIFMFSCQPLETRLSSLRCCLIYSHVFSPGRKETLSEEGPNITSLGETPKYLVSAPTKAVNTFLLPHLLLISGQGRGSPWLSPKGCSGAPAVSAGGGGCAVRWQCPRSLRGGSSPGTGTGSAGYCERRCCGTG